MKKRILISVVLTVFLLEVGFGVSVALERKYESALNSINLPLDAVKQIETDNDRELEMASLLPAEDFFADTHVSVAAKRPPALPIKSNKPGRKIVPASLNDKPTAKPVVRTRTEPIVSSQLVAEKNTETFETLETDPLAKKETPRTENKSFIAKTQTILKKPFSWIKAIGSKLR